VRIVSIINQKGGCGKTTSAINLAGIFARRGCRTLLVDMDPQSHCAAGLAIPEQRIDLDIGDAMLAEGGGRPVDKARLLWRAMRNLDLAPSRMKLAGLEAAQGGLADKLESERRLAMVLSRLAPSYDICFVDCSPSIGLLTFNALAAATHILIPVETSFFALQGATKQVSTIRSVAKRLGSTPEYWLIPTLHDEASVLSRDLLEELRRRFDGRVAPVAVRRDMSLKEAASFGQPVIEYAPGAAGASDYNALADWLAARVGLPGAIRAVEPAGRAGRAGDRGAPSVHVEPKPVSPEKLEAGSRAEEIAQRARVMLLKQADEELRRVTGQGSAAMAEVAERPEAPAPLAAAASLRGLGTPVHTASVETAPVAEQVRNFFGARQTRSGVLFVQPLSLGTWVAIAGEFNNWTPSESQMRRNEELGVFELCVPLKPGRCRYRLVVEGRWITDPSNPRTEPNEYGEFNSIIDVAAMQG
jgi:chromosome partitioning protein